MCRRAGREHGHHHIHPPSGLAMFRIRRLNTHSVSRALRYASTSRPCASLPMDRYQEKLRAKAQQMGVGSVDELTRKLQPDIEAKKKLMNAVDPLAELEAHDKELALQQQASRDKAFTERGTVDKHAPHVPYKTLQSFVDVAKVRDLPAKELEFIWRARFANRDRAMSAVLLGEQFSRMFANAFKNPSFILPLPKEGAGYEMHFVQWGFVGPHTTHCMLTSLAEYKLHKEYAKPHTTLMFHQDIMHDNGLVLMNGQVEPDVPLSLDDAQMLVLNVQRFYGVTECPRKLALLRAFTKGDDSFDMDALIHEAASM